MKEGSADAPRQTRGLRIAGVAVTSLNTGVKQFHCKPHGAFVTAFLKPGFGWKISASCRICDQAALQPILDAIQAAESNGNGARARPNGEPASARESEAEKRAGPTPDAWRLAIHDRAHHECEKLMKAGSIGADLLRTRPLEAFVATVNEQRNLPNDKFTHDPNGLTSLELEREVETIAYALQEQYQKAGDSEPPNDESSGVEVVPPPDPIDLDTPNLDLMPRGIFPEWSEDYIDAVSAETETPRELAAAMELGCYATANQRKAVIEIKPGYREPLNLFVMPAMDSGNRKSAVVNKVTGTVRNWQSEQVEAQKPLIKQAHSFRETDLARIAELRKQAAKTRGDELTRLRGELAELERALPEVPAPFLMITGDTTIEKLGPLLVNNDECMSIFDDESGFLEILGGRYSSGIPNLELVLQCYSGSPVQVSRLGREGVTLHSPALTVSISPQPEFLRGLAVRKPEFRTRGFFARCLFLLPPSPLGYRTGDGPPIPDAVERAHDKAIRALLSAKRPADGPNVIKLSAEAYAAFRAFSAQIETTMREGGSLEHMRDFAGKTPGTAARIAGNLHRANLALHSDPFSVDLPQTTMMHALDCADVFIKHAIAAFDLMGTSEDITGARKVWEWIKRERKPRFTFHEAHLALRGSFQRSDDLETPIEVLVERYYIIPVQPDPSVPRPRGRPTRPFEVNPKLSERWKS